MSSSSLIEDKHCGANPEGCFCSLQESCASSAAEDDWAELLTLMEATLTAFDSSDTFFRQGRIFVSI